MFEKNKNTMIPKGYKKQSEIDDWLPGVKSIRDKNGILLIEDLLTRSIKRKSRMYRDFHQGLTFTCLGAVLYVPTIALSQSIHPFFFVCYLAASVLLMFYGFWCFRNFRCNGIHGNNEPNLRDLYNGPLEHEFAKLLDYWEKLLNSSHSIYIAIGKNSLGRPSNFKFKEFGVLALIGDKKQREGIFSPFTYISKDELLLPDIDLLVCKNNDEDKKSAQPSIIEQIIFHENDEEANDFLIRLSTIIDKEPTKKSLIARRRWVDIISITRANRHIKNNQKREASVRLEMIEKGIELKPPSPLEEISKYYTYRDAEKALHIYLHDQHLLKNNLAKHLRTQLTQLR